MLFAVVKVRNLAVASGLTIESSVTVSVVMPPSVVADRMDVPSLRASMRESVPSASVTRAVPGKHGSAPCGGA